MDLREKLLTGDRCEHRVLSCQGVMLSILHARELFIIEKLLLTEHAALLDLSQRLGELRLVLDRPRNEKMQFIDRIVFEPN